MYRYFFIITFYDNNNDNKHVTKLLCKFVNIKIPLDEIGTTNDLKLMFDLERL